LITVATCNVNGIRAAMRRGMGTWLDERKPDILLLQEVRAPEEMLDEFFPAADGWHVAQQACRIKGRAGVAVASRLPLTAVRIGLGSAEPPVDTGRWVEADVALPSGGALTAVSVYIHSGAADDPKKMAEKYAYLSKATARLAQMATGSAPVLVSGDVNIAHRTVDIANWKGNLKSAGFLPEERAYLDQWFAPDGPGWTDLGRAFGGEGPGPYTWWSWRGKAFDNDTGWRIDYHLANPALAPAATGVEIDKAASYDARFSDHAPVIVTLAM
jgi:exodeoxyribonuclease-3